MQPLLRYPFCFLVMMASSSSYSWEDPSREWRFQRPVPPDGGDSESSEDDSEPTAKEAGEYMVQFLLELLYTNNLSARSLCVICYWASLSGAQGFVSDYKLKPDSPSGHFQRKVDKVTGIDLRSAASDMYKIAVPQHSKYDLSRSSHDMVINVPHEQFVNEVCADPHAASGPLDPEWTQACHEHAVVRANPGNVVMPYAFYLDGISFTKNDSLLGMFVYSLYTFKRHLCMVFRRSNMCKCGCRGWCTLFPAFVVLHWSFSALASGVWPTTDQLANLSPKGLGEQRKQKLRLRSSEHCCT